MMRNIIRNTLIVIPVLVILGFAFGNFSYAQGGMGAPTNTAPPKTSPGNTLPATRKRTNVRPRNTRSAPPAEEKPEESVPVERTVEPGIEEKNQGLEAYKKEDYETAATKLAIAASHQRTDSEILFPLGDSYVFKKEWQKAIDIYLIALQYGEAKATADNYLYLGIAYGQIPTPNYGEALKALKKSDEKRPNNAETLTQMGDAANNLSDYQGAINYYQRALEVDPNLADGEVFYNWALAFENQRPPNHEAAITKFQRAIELKVDRMNEAYYLLGVSSMAAKRTQEGVSAFQKQLTIISNDEAAWKAYFTLKDYYFSIGDWQETIRTCKGALLIKPDDGFTWDKLGIALNNDGKYAEAAEAHRQAVLLDSKRADWQLHLGRAYYRAQKYSEAIETLTRAIDIQPDLSEAFYFRGISYRSLEQYEQAATSLTKALEIGFSKQELDARYNLAIVYSKSGNAPLAKQQCDLLVQRGWDMVKYDSFHVCPQ